MSHSAGPAASTGVHVPTGSLTSRHGLTKPPTACMPSAIGKTSSMHDSTIFSVVTGTPREPYSRSRFHLSTNHDARKKRKRTG